MIELAQSDNERFASYLLQKEDLDSPEGQDIYLQFRSLLSREAVFDDEDREDLLEAAPEIFDDGSIAQIIAWDFEAQAVVGSHVLNKTDPVNGIAHSVGYYVRNDTRQQGVSKLLHQAGIQHLTDEGFTAITTHIAPDNEASVKSAVGQGFRLVEETQSDLGIPVGVYQLDLAAQVTRDVDHTFHL